MNTATQTQGDVLELVEQPPVSHQAPAVIASQALQAGQESPTSPDKLLAMAMQQGASIELLERFIALKERTDATIARTAYADAMALAKRSPPTIVKDKFVSFDTSKGNTSYSHATLGNVVRSVVSWLAEYGFSHAWKVEQLDGGRISVTCTLTHSMGHSESVTLDSFKEDSGTKNNIQAMGSAITYMERYTLFAVTGLAAEDQDDDGAGSGDSILSELEMTRLNIVNRVKLAQTVEELNAAKKGGVSELNRLRDRDFYDTFVKEVQVRGAAIRAKEESNA